MNFDETNKVIIDTMNTDEARAFVLFLKSEIARHQMDIDNARDLCYTVINKFELEDWYDRFNGNKKSRELNPTD